MAPRLFLVVVITAASVAAFAQAPPGAEFSRFINSNERFGRKLLQETHFLATGQNIAVSPLPVSLTVALVLQGSSDGTTLDQIQRAFDWDHLADLGALSRMLMTLVGKQPHEDSREELWTSTTFSYRGTEAIWLC